MPLALRASLRDVQNGNPAILSQNLLTAGTERWVRRNESPMRFCDFAQNDIGAGPPSCHSARSEAESQNLLTAGTERSVRRNELPMRFCDFAQNDRGVGRRVR